MTWMNEYDVAEAREHWAGHELLGPATQTLANLVEWTNKYSDGWPYWKPPINAAKQLMDLIGGYVSPGSAPRCPDPNCHIVAGSHTHRCARPDVTRAALRKAYRPLKSFRTRRGHMPYWDIEEV